MITWQQHLIAPFILSSQNNRKKLVWTQFSTYFVICRHYNWIQHTTCSFHLLSSHSSIFKYDQQLRVSFVLISGDRPSLQYNKKRWLGLFKWKMTKEWWINKSTKWQLNKNKYTIKKWWPYLFKCRITTTIFYATTLTVRNNNK